MTDKISLTLNSIDRDIVIEAFEEQLLRVKAEIGAIIGRKEVPPMWLLQKERTYMRLLEKLKPVDRSRIVEIPVVVISEPTLLSKLILQEKLAVSIAEAKRMLAEKCVRVDGHLIDQYDYTVDKSCFVQVGRRKFMQIEWEGKR